MEMKKSPSNRPRNGSISEGGFGEQCAGQKRAERHGKTGPGNRKGNQRNDEKRRRREGFTRSRGSNHAENAVEPEFADQNNQRHNANRFRGGDRAALLRADAGDNRHRSQQRDHCNILKQQHRKGLRAVGGVELAPVFHPLQGESGG